MIEYSNLLGSKSILYPLIFKLLIKLSLDNLIVLTVTIDDGVVTKFTGWTVGSATVGVGVVVTEFCVCSTSPPFPYSLIFTVVEMLSLKFTSTPFDALISSIDILASPFLIL